MNHQKRPCSVCKVFFRDRMGRDDNPTDAGLKDKINVLDTTLNPQDRTRDGIAYFCQRRRCKRTWVVFEDLGGDLPYNYWPTCSN